MCGMDRCFLWGRVSYCAGVVVRREMLSFIGEAVLFGAAKAHFGFFSNRQFRFLTILNIYRSTSYEFDIPV